MYTHIHVCMYVYTYKCVYVMYTYTHMSVYYSYNALICLHSNITYPNMLCPSVCTQVIPAEVDILPNLASVHNDSQVFSNPNMFNPDRYLDGDMKLTNNRTLPFGMGE